jgi:hypothetical protein
MIGLASGIRRAGETHARASLEATWLDLLQANEKRCDFPTTGNDDRCIPCEPPLAPRLLYCGHFYRCLRRACAQNE